MALGGLGGCRGEAELIANQLHLIAFGDLSSDKEGVESSVMKTSKLGAKAGVKSVSASSFGAWRDRLGIALSMLCLIHCLLTPAIVGLLPVGAMLGFWQHGFHEVFLIVVPLVALIAFVPGWRAHRDGRVWSWGASGVALLIAGVMVAEAMGHDAPMTWPALLTELLFTSVGGACLIRAHMLNRALCVCCELGHDHTHLRGSAVAPESKPGLDKKSLSGAAVFTEVGSERHDHASCGHDHGPHGHRHAP